MRVGPQYQAVVPDFDLGKNLNTVGSLEQQEHRSGRYW